MPTLMKPNEKIKLAERLVNHVKNDKKYYMFNAKSKAIDTLLLFAMSELYVDARNWHNLDYDYYPEFADSAYTLVYNALTSEYPYSGFDEYCKQMESLDAPYTRWHYSNDNAVTKMTRVLQYFKIYIDFPFIEQLVKAGIYLFLNSNVEYRWTLNTDISTLMKRNFNPAGKSLKEITKLPSYVLSSNTIRNVRDLKTWNELRIAVQKYIKSKEDWEAFSMFTEHHPGGWGQIIKKAKSLLNSGYYTLSGLINYLHRVDLYQAVGLDDAMQLLTDYISMCKQCDVKPDINTNSLKREHDVLQRNFWTLKAIARDEEFMALAEGFKKFEYSDDEFMIIAPKSASDVINEGVNQRNCVGAYVNRVIDGQTVILFLRRKDNPEKSLVTIEISPETYSVRQHLMARNDHVTSVKILNFIEKWQEKIREGMPSEEELDALPWGA
jgi:hypothetical protein